MAKIPLSKGLFAIVDDEDAELLLNFEWYALASRRPGVGYAVRGRSQKGGAPGGTLYMHREILQAPASMFVDHINHDTLDNRRANLRLATSSDNAANARRKVGITGFRGVRFDKRDNAFLVQVKGDSCRFKSAVEAAHAYDTLAKKHFGDFAVLNFPHTGMASLQA